MFSPPLFIIIILAQRPPPLTGYRIAKLFHTTVHYGSISGTDVDKLNGAALWTVNYDDGDLEDFEMDEILAAIKLFAELS